MKATQQLHNLGQCLLQHSTLSTTIRGLPEYTCSALPAPDVVSENRL